jgi:hypothetical protein
MPLTRDSKRTNDSKALGSVSFWNVERNFWISAQLSSFQWHRALRTWICDSDVKHISLPASTPRPLTLVENGWLRKRDEKSKRETHPLRDREVVVGGPVKRVRAELEVPVIGDLPRDRSLPVLNPGSESESNHMQPLGITSPSVGTQKEEKETHIRSSFAPCSRTSLKCTSARSATCSESVQQEQGKSARG